MRSFPGTGRSFHRDWERVARNIVGSLRVEAAKHPVLWGAQEVYVFREGLKRLRHPVVGDLELEHETLVLPDEGGLQVAMYGALPGSPSEDALRLLASWPQRDHQESRDSGIAQAAPDDEYTGPRVGARAGAR
jgi:MmyB-like transcription regulator ligand binding domain